jgi:hypothetical protein
LPTTWNRFAYANANPLTFSDPTGQFGVARLAFSFGLQSIPVAGDLYSGLTGLFGSDWIAGYDLSDGERFLAVGAAIPGGPAIHLLNRLRDVVQDGIAAVRNSRLAARAGDLAQHGVDAVRNSRLVGRAGDLAGAFRRSSIAEVRGPAPQTTRVFRVEGPANARLEIDKGGDVMLKGDNTLFLNFGDEARAQAFLQQRLTQGYEGTVIKSFEVPASYVDELRSAAVPERLAGRYPNSPIVVDATRAADQFGLRQEQFGGLMCNIIPGSGRVSC